jgi:hypothetical protein
MCHSKLYTTAHHHVGSIFAFVICYLLSATIIPKTYTSKKMMMWLLLILLVVVVALWYSGMFPVVGEGQWGSFGKWNVGDKWEYHGKPVVVLSPHLSPAGLVLVHNGRESMHVGIGSLTKMEASAPAPELEVSDDVFPVGAQVRVKSDKNAGKEGTVNGKLPNGVRTLSLYGVSGSGKKAKEHVLNLEQK